MLRINGHELMLGVPRYALDLPADRAVELDFKWWDNAHQPGDIMDTCSSGDAAPDSRFNDRFVASSGKIDAAPHTSE